MLTGYPTTAVVHVTPGPTTLVNTRGVRINPITHAVKTTNPTTVGHVSDPQRRSGEQEAGQRLNCSTSGQRNVPTKRHDARPRDSKRLGSINSEDRRACNLPVSHGGRDAWFRPSFRGRPATHIHTTNLALTRAYRTRRNGRGKCRSESRHQS